MSMDLKFDRRFLKICTVLQVHQMDSRCQYLRRYSKLWTPLRTLTRLRCVLFIFEVVGGFGGIWKFSVSRPRTYLGTRFIRDFTMGSPSQLRLANGLHKIFLVAFGNAVPPENLCKIIVLQTRGTSEYYKHNYADLLAASNGLKHCPPHPGAHQYAHPMKRLKGRRVSHTVLVQCSAFGWTVQHTTPRGQFICLVFW